MPIRQALQGPFAAMAQLRQFVVYKLVPSQTRPGKMDKLPCDFRTGQVVSAHDSQYWTDAWTALAAATNFGQVYGLAFVFTEVDNFWFLDIDSAYNPVDPNNPQGEWAWSPLATQFCQVFQGAAIEVSQSGRGLHIFGTGRPPAHGCKNEPLKLEFYSSKRFVALTGVNAIGNATADFSPILPAVISQYFPPDAVQAMEQGWTEGPCSEWRGPQDDDELIRRALRSQSTAAAFGNRASFADLWNCNIDALCRAYPDPVRGYNSSQADAALAQHLAFWTGKDCERIERLMQKSALVRDKWEREDYLPRTILGSVGRQLEVLTDKAPEPLPDSQPVAAASSSTEPPRPSMVTGSTYVSVEQQLDLFAGCVYIRDMHRVLVPGGQTVKPEQFKVSYGGYTLPMDLTNEKVTRDAWEAFTQSQAFRCPRADATCFRPDLPPATIVERNGQKFVNTYWPVEVPRKLGDVTRFLTHLAKLVPNERDRQILLSYMAACVQFQGSKFQWAPLVQGVEGNGKTLLARCVAEAVGRRYVHWPKASKLSKEFNAWMLNKVFYAVEDIYTPTAKAEVIEELKPMITGGDGLEIEGKGVDQISADVCGNFMFNSNHKDAVKKTENDRRFCIFYTAQQRAEDLKRDGMDGDYMQSIYNWLRLEGYAIVSELLWTFPIPAEFNPAVDRGGLAGRAPLTSSTEAAISASVGGIEQEIQEAIAQGLPGFCEGWISSIQLDKLLERLGAARRITHGKRREMLQAMGYDYHPALNDGRVNNMVMPDAGKPRLYIHKGSPAMQLGTAAEVAHAYEQANGAKSSLPPMALGNPAQAFGLPVVTV